MHHLQRSWVRSQHPSAQWNLRGGRWSSVKYRTKKKNPPPKKSSPATSRPRPPPTSWWERRRKRRGGSCLVLRKRSMHLVREFYAALTGASIFFVFIFICWECCRLFDAFKKVCGRRYLPMNFSRLSKKGSTRGQAYTMHMVNFSYIEFSYNSIINERYWQQCHMLFNDHLFFFQHLESLRLPFRRQIFLSSWSFRNPFLVFSLLPIKKREKRASSLCPCLCIFKCFHVEAQYHVCLPNLFINRSAFIFIINFVFHIEMKVGQLFLFVIYSKFRIYSFHISELFRSFPWISNIFCHKLIACFLCPQASWCSRAWFDSSSTWRSATRTGSSTGSTIQKL